MKIKLAPTFIIAFLLWNCNGSSDNSGYSGLSNESAPFLDFVLIKSYPHDTTSFTEGFLFHNGSLYESTGANRELSQTKSLFGIVDLTTGKIDEKVELDKIKYFGEGITILNGKVFQLTYKNRIGFIYDENTFEKLGVFTIPSKEGWGLTTDGNSLIMSDGTYKLTYLDPKTLQVIKTISVTENGYAKEFLNELEFIDGYIFANIWTTNTIAKIDTADGKVKGLLDLTPLCKEAKNLYPGSLEMNGIAFDSVANTILATGKLWPKIFEIKISN